MDIGNQLDRIDWWVHAPSNRQRGQPRARLREGLHLQRGDVQSSSNHKPTSIAILVLEVNEAVNVNRMVREHDRYPGGNGC